MAFYRRNLPHWHPEETTLFITWRLSGSLPAHVEAKRKKSSAGPLEPRSAGREFVALDRQLDRATSGPLWLGRPPLARCIADCIHYGAATLRFYDLFSFVVMPNHVHILLRPLVSVPRITRGLKGVSARRANRLLHRTGKTFWQDESFDHWVRDEAEFEKIVRYIETNPVKAGLVARPEDWPWSSAAKKGP